MLSTATIVNKKFEVAPTHKAYFYGGLYGEDGTRVDGATPYLEEEVKTRDAWITGQPIYRRVFPYTISANEDGDEKVIAQAFSTDLGQIVSIDGYFRFAGSSGILFYPIMYYSSSSYHIRSYVRLNNDTTADLIVSASRAGEGYVILYYTKASETPTT